MERVELPDFLKRLGDVVGTATSPEPIIHLQFLLRPDDDEYEQGKKWGLNTYIYRIGESSADWAKVSDNHRVTTWRFEHMNHEVLEVLPPRRSVLRNYGLPTLRIN
jgi:hypothetical protein